MPKTEQEQRDAVVAEAMSWIGTPHHNGARLRGVGVDCGQLPIAVYHACGHMPDIRPEAYPADFALHSREEWYLSIAQKYGREVQEAKRGDFILYRFGRVFSHGAIVVEWPIVIHSFIKQGVVKADASQPPLSLKISKIFTIWGN